MKSFLLTFCLLLSTIVLNAYPPEWGELKSETVTHKKITATFVNGVKMVTYADGVVYIYKTTKDGYLGHPRIIYPEK